MDMSKEKKFKPIVFNEGSVSMPTFEEMAEFKKSKGIEEPIEADFFSLTSRGEFYHVVKKWMENAIENSGGIVPVGFHGMIRDEVEKAYYHVLCDATGDKGFVLDRFRVHKYRYDNKLIRFNLYNYYSPRLPTFMKDIEI